MLARVSFQEFLTTGRLGPFHGGLSSPEVGALLGAPTHWIVSQRDVFPHHWGYRNLEMCFDYRPPHAMEWFQIEHAHTLHGDCEILGGINSYGLHVVLALEGFSGRSRPSEFLAVMRDGREPLHLVYRHYPGHMSFRLSLCNGTIEVIFRGEFAEEMVAAVTGLDDVTLFRHCERLAMLDSIYSFSRRPDRERLADVERKVEPAAFLAAVET